MARQNLPDKDQFINKIIGEYILEKEIGRGKIGVVYRARHNDIQGLMVAIKIIPQDNLKNDWKKEIEKVSMLDGIKQVIQLKGPPEAKLLNDIPYVCIFWQYVDDDNLKE